VASVARCKSTCLNQHQCADNDESRFLDLAVSEGELLKITNTTNSTFESAYARLARVLYEDGEQGWLCHLDMRFRQ